MSGALHAHVDVPGQVTDRAAPVGSAALHALFGAALSGGSEHATAASTTPTTAAPPHARYRVCVIASTLR
jgi:hypothetical protein